MQLQRLNLFASPLCTGKLRISEDERLRMVHAIRQLRESTSEVKQKSNYGGWHSGVNFLDRPDFLPLRQSAIAISKQAIKSFGLEPGHLQFHLAGWANVHDKGGFNAPHMHPGSWVSGVFYLSTPPGSGQIYFVDPRLSVRTLGLPTVKPTWPPKDDTSTANMHGNIKIEPDNLTYYAFPGWFEHGVTPCETEERISVAWNFSPMYDLKKVS